MKKRNPTMQCKGLIPYDQAEDELLAEKATTVYENMKIALEEGNDYVAVKYAEGLRCLNYYSYRDEIENCFHTCAMHGNTQALLHCERRFQHKGVLTKEEFPILKLLVEQGYTKAFERMGDFYFNGIGCEKSPSRAMYYYLSGVLFWYDLSCMDKIEKYYKPRSDWDNFPKEITDLFSDDFEDEDYYENTEKAFLRMANAIYDGKIKEYDSKTAYFIYKRYFKDDFFWLFDEPEYSSIPCINLAMCLMYGEGCVQNEPAAYYVLEDALSICEEEKKRGVESADERIADIEQKLKLLEHILLEKNDFELEEVSDWWEDDEDFVK